MAHRDEIGAGIRELETVKGSRLERKADANDK
jgi:hypothetical protein